MSYRDYQRQRQLTLGDLLLENRIILLQGEIHDGNAAELVMKLLYLQSENRRKQIHFYINSPGGSVSAALAIYDTMQIPAARRHLLRGPGCQRRRRVAGRRSQGQAIFAAPCQSDDPPALRPGGGTGLGYRNPGRRDHQGQAPQQNPGRPHRPAHRTIAKDTNRDYYMHAEEAKAYGVVDEILTKPPADSKRTTKRASSLGAAEHIVGAPAARAGNTSQAKPEKAPIPCH